MITDLATLNPSSTWVLAEDHAGGSTGSYRACVFSDAHSGHVSNLVPEIDLSWCEPEDIRKFAQALLTVADRVEADRDNDDED